MNQNKEDILKRIEELNSTPQDEMGRAEQLNLIEQLEKLEKSKFNKLNKEKKDE